MMTKSDCPECAKKEGEGFDSAESEDFDELQVEEPWLLDDVHARVLWPTYRHALWFVPALKVRLTRPLGALPVGTRLTLRLNDHPGNGRKRRVWRRVLPGKRVVAIDAQLGKEGEVLREGSELWVLYLDWER